MPKKLKGVRRLQLVCDCLKFFFNLPFSDSMKPSHSVLVSANLQFSCFRRIPASFNVRNTSSTFFKWWSSLLPFVTNKISSKKAKMFGTLCSISSIIFWNSGGIIVSPKNPVLNAYVPILRFFGNYSVWLFPGVTRFAHMHKACPMM